MSVEDDIHAAINAIKNQHYEPHPCALGRHVVTRRAKARGYGHCMNCCTPLGQWPTADGRNDRTA